MPVCFQYSLCRCIHMLPYFKCVDERNATNKQVPNIKTFSHAFAHFVKCILQIHSQLPHLISLVINFFAHAFVFRYAYSIF